jgi:ribosome-associated protein
MRVRDDDPNDDDEELGGGPGSAAADYGAGADGIRPPTEGRGRGIEKRNAEALQALGEELIRLKPEQLARFDLPDGLRDAVLAAQRITSHGALRRQRQYVGKLMRKVDGAPIRARLLEVRGEDAMTRARLHRAERWRDRLVAEGDAALTELLAEAPQADRVRLRTLTRDAQRERANDAPPRAQRELFRLLRELFDDAAEAAGRGSSG